MHAVLFCLNAVSGAVDPFARPFNAHSASALSAASDGGQCRLVTKVAAHAWAGELERDGSMRQRFTYSFELSSKTPPGEYFVVSFYHKVFVDMAYGGALISQAEGVPAKDAVGAIELQLGRTQGKAAIELQGRRERPLESSEDPAKFMHTQISCQSVAERAEQLEEERVRAAYAKLVHGDQQVQDASSTSGTQSERAQNPGGTAAGSKADGASGADATKKKALGAGGKLAVAKQLELLAQAKPNELADPTEQPLRVAYGNELDYSGTCSAPQSQNCDYE